MPARPFAPTNVVRQDIELLDNLKASGNIALYEEARSAVFEKHSDPINNVLNTPALTPTPTYDYLDTQTDDYIRHQTETPAPLENLPPEVITKLSNIANLAAASNDHETARLVNALLGIGTPDLDPQQPSEPFGQGFVSDPGYIGVNMPQAAMMAPDPTFGLPAGESIRTIPDNLSGAVELYPPAAVPLLNQVLGYMAGETDTPSDAVAMMERDASQSYSPDLDPAQLATLRDPSPIAEDGNPILNAILNAGQRIGVGMGGQFMTGRDPSGMARDMGYGPDHLAQTQERLAAQQYYEQPKDIVQDMVNELQKKYADTQTVTLPGDMVVPSREGARERSYPEQVLEAGVGSAVPMLTGIGAGALVRNPRLISQGAGAAKDLALRVAGATPATGAALAGMGTSVFQSEYGRLLNEGFSEKDAGRKAMKSAINETGPEALFFGPMMMFKGVLGSLLMSIPGEAASEALTEVLTIRDEINDGAKISLPQAWERVKHAGAIGAGLGPLMGSAIALPTLIAKGLQSKTATREDVRQMLLAMRLKAEESGSPKGVIAIIDQLSEQSGDHNLSQQEFEKALEKFNTNETLGAFFQAYGNEFVNWEAWGRTGEEAAKKEGGGVILADPDIMLQEAARTRGRMPTVREVKRDIRDLIEGDRMGHEGFHRRLRVLFNQANADSTKIDAFFNRLFEENEAGVNRWIQTPMGRAYIDDPLITAKDQEQIPTLGLPEVLENVRQQTIERFLDEGLLREEAEAQAARVVTNKRNEVVEEYLANELRNKTTLGGKYYRGIKRLLNSEVGINLDTVSSKDLLEQLEKSTPAAAEQVIPQVEETVDTSQADLEAAREATQVQFNQAEEQLDSVIRDVTGEERFSKPPIDIDKRRETAIAKATAPNEDIRYSDTRIASVREDWKDNELDLRREYGNFETFEQAEWDLNYDMWIDDIQAAELEDATQARVLQENILEEQLSGFERDFTGDTRFAKKASEMNEAEKLNRNVRNDFAKGPYKEIIGRPDEADIRARIKRLGNLYGPMGQKRGIEPGDRATAKEQAQNAIDNVEAFEEFMAPFEAQMKEQPAKSRTATGRQEKYAQRKGITVAEILSYRERGKIHPMEKKMSYTFGIEEIDILEAEGKITADEAEIRRRTLNDLRNQLGGKMPPGAKRKATEIVYGIGDYASIEAWDYTEAETAGMGERAEVARGQERVRGLRRTEKTEKELEEITGSDVTPTEMMQISAMREVEAFDRFTTDMERLTYLREKEAMPASERRALDAFMRDMRGWDEAAYEAQLAAEREAQVQKVGVTRVKQTAAQRKAELKSMKEAQAPIEKRKHVQVEPDFFDTLVDTNFTIQGESVPEGFMELTEDGVVSEVDETDTSTRYAKPFRERRWNALTDTARKRFGAFQADGLPIVLEELDQIYEDAVMSDLTDEQFRAKLNKWLNVKISKSGEVNRDAAWTRKDYMDFSDQFDAKYNEIVVMYDAPFRKIKSQSILGLIDAATADQSLTPLQQKLKVESILNEYRGIMLEEHIDLVETMMRDWVGGKKVRRDMSQKTTDLLLKHKVFGSKIGDNYVYFNKERENEKDVLTPKVGKFVEQRRILYPYLKKAGKVYNPGNPINRGSLEKESVQDSDVRKVFGIREALNRAGKPRTYFVDHVKELVNIRDVEALKGIEKEIKPKFDRHVSSNLAVLYKPVHDMKSRFTEHADSDSVNQARQDSESPLSDMLEFMENPKKSEEAESERFIAHYTDKWGISESDLISKLDAYLKTTKQGARAQNNNVIESTVRAAATWEGAEVDTDLLKMAQAQDAALNADEALAKTINASVTRYAKRAKGESYEEHFNKNFWYTLTSYLWGKPVQAIRDFNKLSRFGQAKADVPAADEIADEIQRAHSSTQRAEPLIYGTDIVQDTSIRTGQFFTRLAQIFSRVTARLGDIETRENQMLVDILTGKVRIEELDNAEHREAAKLLRELMQDVYNYAKTETKGLKDPLDLRGHGDTLLPRVWNIEFLATRRGKAKFLKAIRAAISDPATGSSILEDADLTVEDLYNVVVNSGGFVQGDWTNLKADQTRDQKEIDRDLKAQEYLDALPTESLIDEDLVMIDLQAIIPRFIQKAVERTEYSKRFGVNDEILRAKIKEGLEQIKVHNAKVLKLDKTDKSLTYIDPKAFEKTVWDMARILRNKYGYDMANMQTRAWLQRVVNFEVIAKLPLVTLASMPELFTPMLRGSVRPDKFVVDLMAGFVWAGYKGMNGISKLLLNKHLPAMRKASAEIGGIGVISDVQLLRELGIAEIQAMGDAVSTRYANPNFARGGLRAGARTTIAGRIPKKVRAVFNMQTYMQATLLTTLTEMQQLMALRNFQRHMAKRVKFVQKNAGKDMKGRRLRLFKQFSKDMADFGLPQNIDLDTAAGEAEFNAGAIRFVDQVITRPNDATTAKAFKNPLTAPIFLFKRFITTFGNTLMTAVGNDIATKVSSVEKAKQVGRIMAAMTAMYGAVMFAEVMRAAIKGDLDEEDMTITGGDFRTFMRRVDRTGLLSAPGAMLLNLSFPYKRGWWDSPEARIWGELGGPIGGDISQLMKTGFDRRPGSAQRLIRQMVPMSKQLIDLPPKKKRKKSKTKKRKVTF